MLSVTSAQGAVVGDVLENFLTRPFWGQSVSSSTHGDFTYSADANFIQQSMPNNLEITGINGVTEFVIRRNDATEFQFVNVEIETLGGLTTIQVRGYRNGAHIGSVAVGSQPGYRGVRDFTPFLPFKDVDEVRFACSGTNIVIHSWTYNLTPVPYDITPPPLTLTLASESDTGVLDTDRVTYDTTPTITYTTEPGAVVEVEWELGAGFQPLASGTGAAQSATLASPYAGDGTKFVRVRATDAANNMTQKTLSLSIDTTPPGCNHIARRSPSTALTNATSLSMLIEFTEPVANLDGTDISTGLPDSVMINAAVGPFMGPSYELSLSGIGLASFNGTLAPSLASGQNITDFAGNPLPPVQPPRLDTYDLDHRMPTATIALVDPTITVVRDSLLGFSLSLSEPVLGLGADDFFIDGATGAIALTAIDPTRYNVSASLNPAGVSGPVTVRFSTTHGITDPAGNGLDESAVSSAYYTVDTIKPTIASITRGNPTTELTNADALTYLVQFNEPVQGLSAQNFALQGGSAAAMDVVAESADRYRVTVSGGDLPSLDGVLQLRPVDGSSVTDTAGNAFDIAAAPAVNETFTLDNTPPRAYLLARLSPTVQRTSADILTWSVNFSEQVTQVSPDDFTPVGTTAMLLGLTTHGRILAKATIIGGDHRAQRHGQP